MAHSLKRECLLGAVAMTGMLLSSSAWADETIKIGMSVPLSGAGAIWGKATEWLCKRAAEEIKESGGVKVQDQVYNFECVAYDNKYTASDGTKVAQTLLNRDGVKFIYGFGTAPILATQTISERQGAMLLNTSWGMSSKGPKFPLTVSVNNTLVEILPALVKYVTQAHPQAKTIVLLNVNDASGRETEGIARPQREKAGVKVLSSDYYERGMTEFQPIAARIAAFKPDIIDVSSAPPADAGLVFKELDVLGFKGIKIMDNGMAADSLLATSGPAGNGVYMGAAMTFDGPSVSPHQRKVNEDARAALGESIGPPTIGAYDSVYMIKAGMEKAQSIDPKEIAAAMPSVTYKTFYGGEAGFAGKAVYGSDIAPQLPVFISQVVDGKVVEKARIDPRQK